MSFIFVLFWTVNFHVQIHIYWIKIVFHSYKCHASVLSHCSEQKLKVWTKMDNDSVPALPLKIMWTWAFYFNLSSSNFLSNIITFPVFPGVIVKTEAGYHSKAAAIALGTLKALCRSYSHVDLPFPLHSRESISWLQALPFMNIYSLNSISKG